MNSISLPSYAKTNLVLDLLYKRPDNFHEVQFVMQQLELHDTITIKNISSNSIQITSNNPLVPLDESNLCYKAAKLMQPHLGREQGISIHIEKKIPIAGGLGGGSTNAVTTLIALNRLWKLNLSKQQLWELASKLGSDCVFFLELGTCVAEGRGEKITKIETCPEMHCVIFDPQIPFIEGKTKKIYSNFSVERLSSHPSVKNLREAIQKKDISKIAKNLGNVFESISLSEYEKVFELLNEIRSNPLCLNAILSGAGPCIFAVAENEKNAKKLAEAFSKQSNAVLTKTIHHSI